MSSGIMILFAFDSFSSKPLNGRRVIAESKAREESGWKECGEESAGGERDQVQPTPV